MPTLSIEQIIADPELKEELKKIVLERVSVMPDTLRVAIGSSDLTKEDMIHHVNDEDEVGHQVMELELEYLRALGSGAVYGGE